MIREAIGSDKNQLFRLYRMLVPNSQKMQVLEEQIEVMKNDRSNFLFVYEENGVILGTVTLNICLQALHGNRPYGIIENIVVDESYRGKGIGHSLLKHVEDYCKLKDCHKIMLLSSSKRIKAHSFFERVGFDGEVSRAFKKYL